MSAFYLEYMQYAQYFWLILMIIFVVIEAVTVSLATIWFAIGALVALVGAWLGLDFIVQIMLFIVSSMLLLVFTRPIAQKYITPKQIKTNAQSVIGKQGMVTKDITEHVYGQVKVGGQMWTAKGETETSIIVGEEIVVTGIEGVKVVVKKNS